MLRAVLLGLLTLSVVGCNKKPDAPAARAGAPAGTVVDVTGTVTVAGKPLGKGATVASDDVIDTGADGHVQIVLAHNHATWDLGPNKHEKVSESIAWTLAKVDTPAKPVDQDTSSAGRPAERAAADTEATGRKDDEAPARAAAAAPAAAVAPSPEASAPPPAPPPPPPAREVAPPLPAVQPVAPPPKTIGHASKDVAPGAGPKSKVEVPVDAYQKCVPGGMTLDLTLRGTARGTTYTVTNGVKLSPAVKACLDKVTAGVHLEAGAHSDLEVAN